MRASHSPALTGLVLALILTAAGCTGGDEPPPSPPGGHTSGTSTGSASSGSASSGSASTDSPAAGPWIRAEAFELRAPVGFTVDDSVSLSIHADDVSTGGSIYVGNRPGAPERSLDEQVRASRDNVPWSGRPERLPDVTIDGVAFYHLVGEQAGLTGVEEYGAIHEGTGVRLSFNLTTAMQRRRDVIDSVLATFAWR